MMVFLIGLTVVSFYATVWPHGNRAGWSIKIQALM